MRHRLLVLLVGLVGLAVAPFPSGTASASCAGPQISVQGVDMVRGHAVLTRGSEVTVRGRYFIDGCDDTGTMSAGGCSSEERETSQPSRDVELVLGQEVVGTEDADEQGRVVWTFTVPDDGRTGLVRMHGGTSQPQWVRIR